MQHVDAEELAGRLERVLGAVPLRNCPYDGQSLHVMRKQFRAGFYAALLLHATHEKVDVPAQRSLSQLSLANKAYGILHAQHGLVMRDIDMDQAMLASVYEIDTYLSFIERVSLNISQPTAV